MSVRSAPQVWDGELDEADPLRVELGKLVVDAEDFWFEAKTAEELPVETCPIDIDQLLEAFSAREPAQCGGLGAPRAHRDLRKRH